MKNAFVLFALAIAVVLGYLTPAQASNQQQRQVQKQVSKQSSRQGFAARLRNRGNGHNNAQQFNAVHHAQQVQAVYLPAQQFRVVPVQAVNAGCHNDNAGVLQLNGGCSALYR